MNKSLRQLCGLLLHDEVVLIDGLGDPFIHGTLLRLLIFVEVFDVLIKESPYQPLVCFVHH